MDKITKLSTIIKSYKSAVIAFSGGVDSTFLAKVAKDILQDKVLLVTATSLTYPLYELEEAKELAKRLGMKHRIVKSEEIDIPGFSDNPPDRCYFCKKELFELVKNIAHEEGYTIVFDGSNADDLNDYRPGLKALRELGIESPLSAVGLKKAEIRKLSEELGLPTSTKPSFACLASRFPYGEKITKEKLERVGSVEKSIRAMGFTQFRVRSHGELARLEFIPGELDKAWQVRESLYGICRDAGYVYVAIDLEGYRTGAMNEVLDQ